MNNLIDKFFIYLESIFRGRLPLKYKGIYIIEDIWVIHYECLSVNPLDIDESMKSSIQARYSTLRACEPVTIINSDEDFKDLFGKTLKSFVCIDQILKNQSVFFNHFKLQDYSEYKSDRRNSIINNLIN